MSGAGGSVKIEPAASAVEGLGIDPVYIEYARQLLNPLMADGCFDKFINLDFSDVDCLKYTLSKGLGVGIIAGSLLVKVPQIVKILRAKSATGITLLSVVMELFAITSTMSYSYVSGFPFSAWGEACFLGFQTAIVAVLVLLFNYGSGLLGLSFLVAYGASIYALISGLTPLDTLWSMQAANVPVIVISKLLQAYTNFRNKSTGQLSAITIFMLLFGSAARIFTSIQETGDQIIIINYAAATFVNALIATQILWYWNSAGKKKAPPKAVGKGGKGKAANSPKKGSPKKKTK
ncbi:Mannose-P-dolichol utilization defect 1 protein [Orchesella cincta]|uniref:Mannose-P-dolichol utilization defect 1 protein homolog n=1 Tax=Orchesella cincta TaxID=48709 RepID=A0A1D2M543_ORCCI|nr:Mannose-P-dolichol utilization defect 1 protein [Orchesella cincta]